MLEKMGDKLLNIISQIDPMDVIFSASLLLVGALLGRLVARRLVRVESKKLVFRIARWGAILIAPLLSVIFLGFALAFADYIEQPSLTLPFALRMAVAWLAIRCVRLLASKNVAGWFILVVISPITILHLFGVWEPLAKLLDKYSISIGSFKLSIFQGLKTVIALMVLFWLARFIDDMFEKWLKRVRSIRASNRTLILKAFQTVLYLVVALIVLNMLGVDLTALAVFSGALGVGLGFGLQKITSNFVSGIILLFEKSIEVDDLVELADGTFGYIRQTSARYTRVEMIDGKDILIPNEEFISQRVTNWTFSNAKGRAEIKVGVAYESDLELAKKLLLEAANEHPKCSKNPQPSCFITQFGDHSIQLVLYFWVDNMRDGRLEPQSDVMFAIWHKFKEHNINIPYPQRVVRVQKDGQFIEVQE